MSDFDESKVQRDEHGRFSGGGLGGFAAKHTGKLEGYGGKGESGAGRLEHDPAKETNALAKWVASKHSIDLDLMKSNKNDRNASTGELTAATSSRAETFVDNELDRLTTQKEALVKEARKAEVSRVGYHNKVQSAKYKLEDVTPAAGDEERDRFTRDEAQKVLDKGAEKKEAQAAAKRDDAHRKLEVVLQQFRAASDAHEAVIRINEGLALSWRHTDTANDHGVSTVKDDKKDYGLNVSHDRQGNWQIDVHGDTRTAGHPGEKSMNYRIEAGAPPTIRSIDKKKNINFEVEGGKIRSAANAMAREETAPKHTLTMTFPSHEKTGASHPLEGEQVGARRYKDQPKVANFFHEVDTSK